MAYPGEGMGMKQVEMENGEVVDAKNPEDPWYEQSDGHVTSGEGFYCPEEGVMIEGEDIPKGTSECPICGGE